MKGYFMELQNLSVNDGEGIRTVVFMGGCPLKCQWCSNPESQGSPANTKGKDILVKEYSIEEIIKIIEKQRIFYRYSKGGVTFSGGEPTMQPDILEELSSRLYDKAIDMVIETNGYFAFENIKTILDRMSLIFVDLKLHNSDDHKQFTGKDNRLILETIESFGKLEYPVVTRIPLIEGVNDDEGNIISTAEFIQNTFKKPKVELLPYHSLGNEKYRILGLELPSSDFKTPGEEKIESVKKLLKSRNIDLVQYK